jgi:hypothetical protein
VSQPDAFAPGHSELNRFLFADVGVESNGTTLSVLSILARLGHDPWQQAEQLAALPMAAAVDTLTKIIAAVPSSPWPPLDASAIATRLVALLPKHQDLSAVPPAKLALNGLQMSWPRAVLLTCWRSPSVRQCCHWAVSKRQCFTATPSLSERASHQPLPEHLQQGRGRLCRLQAKGH